MAMPTRSARMTGFGDRSPTPVTIGPGSYLGTFGVSRTRPSLAAFSSSELRSWQGKPSTPAVPGPGSYVGYSSVAPNEGESRPSYCFESRVPRLAPQYTGSTEFTPSTTVEVPGPGTYDTRISHDLYAERDTYKEYFRQKPMYAFPKRLNPPSVPRRGQSFGYNVDPKGRLTALPAPISTRAGDRLDCAGPGDYDPQDKESWVKPGMVIFRTGSRKTVFDKEWVVDDHRPGPGHYNPKLRPRYHLEMPGSSPFMSGVPKGSDIRCQSGPGPGSYSQHSMLDENTPRSSIQHLGGSGHREAWLRSEECPFSEPKTGHIPGPGAYVGHHDNSSFKKIDTKTLSDERVGFGSTGRRMSQGPCSRAQSIPGPGQYDLEMVSIMGTLRHRSRIGCKGVFGSSGDRFQHKAPGERRENMTPMRLWDQGKVLKRVVVFRSIPQPMSSFKSETSRFKSGTDKLVDRSPADGTGPTVSVTCSLRDSFDKRNKKREKSKPGSFLSTSQRFCGGVFDSKSGSNELGPGAYNIATTKVAQLPPRSRSKPKPTLPQSARFNTSPYGQNDEVGPGSHEIAGSLMKKTFNVTFGGGGCTPAHAGRVARGANRIRKMETNLDQAQGLPATTTLEDTMSREHNKSPAAVSAVA